MFETKDIELTIRVSAEDILILHELTELSKKRYKELLGVISDDPYDWDEEVESRMAVWGRRIQFLEKLQKGIEEQIKKNIKEEVMKWQDGERC